jgi:hypothetical protein
MCKGSGLLSNHPRQNIAGIDDRLIVRIMFQAVRCALLSSCNSDYYALSLQQITIYLMPYQKTLPLVSYLEFLDMVSKETHHTSSSGKRYHVSGIMDEVLFIVRLDACTDMDWDIDLKKLYQAYRELDDFATENFRPYVPRRYSPARGLLLRLGLIA